jgi:hypothetical protein
MPKVKVTTRGQRLLFDNDFTVENYLGNMVTNAPTDSAIFGPLMDGFLRMPSKSSDGRARTWEKTVSSISKNIINKPKSQHWCWFMNATVSSKGEYKPPNEKLSKDGSTNKWTVHRILHSLVYQPTEVLVKPGTDDTTIGCTTFQTENLQLAHSCFWGSPSQKMPYVCVNPHHTHGWVDSEENNSHKGCKFGSYYLCPHQTKCFWSHLEDGRPMDCFNSPKYMDCKCSVECKHKQ